RLGHRRAHERGTATVRSAPPGSTTRRQLDPSEAVRITAGRLGVVSVLTFRASARSSISIAASKSRPSATLAPARGRRSVAAAGRTLMAAGTRSPAGSRHAFKADAAELPRAVGQALDAQPQRAGFQA